MKTESNTPFADALDSLTPEECGALNRDLIALKEESELFDTIASAREELRKRIGGWANLKGYAQVLLAGERRRNDSR